jgi:tetratricopeptide (TPR) repeat protein
MDIAAITTMEAMRIAEDTVVVSITKSDSTAIEVTLNAPKTSVSTSTLSSESYNKVYTVWKELYPTNTEEQYSSFVDVFRKINATTKEHLTCKTGLDMWRSVIKRMEIVYADDVDQIDEVKLVFGCHLYNQCQYEEAEQYLRASVAKSYVVNGGHHADTIQGLRNLSSIYRKQGKLEDAHATSVRAMEISKSMYGNESEQVLRVMGELTDVLRDQRKYQEGEEVAQKILKIIETRGNQKYDQVIYLRTLNSLGMILSAQLKFTESKALFRRALDIIDNKLEKDPSADVIEVRHLPRVTGDILNNLAGCCSATGGNQTKEEERYYKRALSIYEELYGLDHPQISTILSNISMLLTEQNRHGEAEVYRKRALDITERVYGPDHLNTALELDDLGGLYCLQQKFQEAAVLLRRSVAIQDRVHGPEDVRAIPSQRLLGGALLHAHLYDEAEVCLERTYKICQELNLLNSDPNAKVVANMVQNSRSIQKDIKEELDVLNEKVTKAENKYGPQGLETATCLCELAKMLQVVLYRYKDATAVLMRALEIYLANKLDSNNRLVKDTLKSLTKALKHQNRNEEAKSILQRVLFGEENK